MFFEVPTRSQFKNKADFDVAHAEYVARRKRCYELSSESFRQGEADYQKTKTQGKHFR